MSPCCAEAASGPSWPAASVCYTAGPSLVFIPEISSFLPPYCLISNVSSSSPHTRRLQLSFLCAYYVKGMLVQYLEVFCTHHISAVPQTHSAPHLGCWLTVNADVTGNSNTAGPPAWSITGSSASSRPFLGSCWRWRRWGGGGVTEAQSKHLQTVLLHHLILVDLQLHKVLCLQFEKSANVLKL